MALQLLKTNHEKRTTYTVILTSSLRNRHYRTIAELEARDEDGDGVPDVYQQQ